MRVRLILRSILYCNQRDRRSAPINQHERELWGQPPCSLLTSCLAIPVLRPSLTQPTWDREDDDWQGNRIGVQSNVFFNLGQVRSLLHIRRQTRAGVGTLLVLAHCQCWHVDGVDALTVLTHDT